MWEKGDETKQEQLKKQHDKVKERRKFQQSWSEKFP